MPVTEVNAGDICAFTGMQDVGIGESVCDSKEPQPLPTIEVRSLRFVALSFCFESPLMAGAEERNTADSHVWSQCQVEEPTVTMTFMVNTSPFAGQEGKFVTSRNIKVAFPPSSPCLRALLQCQSPLCTREETLLKKPLHY